MGEVKYHDPAIPDEEMRAALEEADAGKVSIETLTDDDWEEQYSGIMVFKLGNGWSVAVFNDCYEWDYIEWVQAPDGRREEFSLYEPGTWIDASYTKSQVLQTWEPKHPERWGKNCPRRLTGN